MQYSHVPFWASERMVEGGSKKMSKWNDRKQGGEWVRILDGRVHEQSGGAATGFRKVGSPCMWSMLRLIFVFRRFRAVDRLNLGLPNSWVTCAKIMFLIWIIPRLALLLAEPDMEIVTVYPVYLIPSIIYYGRILRTYTRTYISNWTFKTQLLFDMKSIQAIVIPFFITITFTFAHPFGLYSRQEGDDPNECPLFTCQCLGGPPGCCFFVCCFELTVSPHNPEINLYSQLIPVSVRRHSAWSLQSNERTKQREETT